MKNEDGRILKDPQIIGDSFNNFFTHIAQNTNSKENNYICSGEWHKSEHSLFFTPTSEAEIIKIISSLRSSGFDYPQRY